MCSWAAHLTLYLLPKPSPPQYNTGQTSGHTGLDLNVVPAWIQGYTGKGVVVSIVDDGRPSSCAHWPCLTITGCTSSLSVCAGLERTHPDLDNNFVRGLHASHWAHSDHLCPLTMQDFSASLNAVEGGSDPSPSYSYDSHGTKCAGIVGMEKNNDHCGVGVAHHANVGGQSAAGITSVWC